MAASTGPSLRRPLPAQRSQAIKRARVGAQIPSLVPAGQAPESLSILELMSVGGGTRTDYQTRLAHFDRFMWENQLSLDGPETIEQALLLYMNQAFIEGER